MTNAPYVALLRNDDWYDRATGVPHSPATRFGGYLAFAPTVEWLNAHLGTDVHAKPIVADLTTVAGRARVVDAVKKVAGARGLYALVNNAGICLPANIEWASVASFEKTTDHLFEAAVHSRSDAVVGVSECIIMGIPIPLGTGLFKLLQRVPKVALPKSEPLLFPTKRAAA